MNVAEKKDNRHILSVSCALIKFQESQMKIYLRANKTFSRFFSFLFFFFFVTVLIFIFLNSVIVGELFFQRNTFQAVLVTDSEQSYAIFNYQKIVWTTGSNSGGETETGLGGDPAVVGIAHVFLERLKDILVLLEFTQVKCMPNVLGNWRISL